MTTKSLTVEPIGVGFNISRKDMPQIKKRQDFLKFLDSKSIKHEECLYPVSSLQVLQTDYSEEKVLSMMADYDNIDTSVILSKDGFVIDGNHRALAAFNRKEPFVESVVVDMDAVDLLGLIRREYNAVYEATPISFRDFLER